MAFEDAEAFDRWWGRNGNIFESEALAVEALLPDSVEDAIVIGNGTGRFAIRLGLSFGIDPSENMCRLSRKKGVDAVQGRAEELPFADEQFSLGVLIGTISYVENLEKALKETHRILKPEGEIVIAFLPKNRNFTNLYETAAEEGGYPQGKAPEFPYPITFIKEATWRSDGEVFDIMHKCGFIGLKTRQTLTVEPEIANDRIEIPQPGHDCGSWVVVKGTKKILQ